MKKLFVFMFVMVCILLCVHVAEANTAVNADGIKVILEENEFTFYDGEHYLRGKIKAYRNDSLIWEQATDMICISQKDLDRLSDVYIDANNVCIVVEKVLYAYDPYTGHLKWTINDCGRETYLDFDTYGNIYVGGWDGPIFIAIDKNGKELYRLQDDPYSNVGRIDIEGDVLKAYYGWRDEEPVEIKEFDISQFKPKTNVVLEGKTLEFDQPPIVINGRTLVPVRAVIEAVGGMVEWDGLTQTVTLSLNGSVIKLIINSQNAYLNNEAKMLDVAPQVINGRTLLPIRFIAEGFGFDVDWDEATNTVIINTHNPQTVNAELLSCVGKTKSEICDIYGEIVNSEYYLGGKYYVHEQMQSQMFYEDDDLNYNYDIHDDADDDAQCLQIFAKLSELINNPDKTSYNIEELESIFGESELTNNLDDENFSECFYKFKYNDYSISIITNRLIPQKIEYVYVFNN